MKGLGCQNGLKSSIYHHSAMSRKGTNIEIRQPPLCSRTNRNWFGTWYRNDTTCRSFILWWPIGKMILSLWQLLCYIGRFDTRTRKCRPRTAFLVMLKKKKYMTVIDIWKIIVSIKSNQTIFACVCVCVYALIYFFLFLYVWLSILHCWLFAILPGCFFDLFFVQTMSSESKSHQLLSIGERARKKIRQM